MRSALHYFNLMRSPQAILALLTLLAASCATAPTQRTQGGRFLKSPVTAGKPGKRMTVRTTAYTHTEAGGRNNAIGTRLRFGGSSSSAATDWSWMPLGTRFKLCCANRNYVVEDYGSALVGRKTIDLYMPTRGTMNQWGVRNVEIEILEWGSRAVSLKLLSGRQRAGYVRTMVAALRRQGP